MDSFGREYNIFTNLVQRNMFFSFTALLAWSGRRRNALLIALTTKENAILIGWWASILAFGEVNNDHSLGFPPWTKSSDLLCGFLYQFLRWAFSCAILWAGRLLWYVVVAAVELLFLVLATLDVTVALLGFFFGRLGLVVSLRATNKMASKITTNSFLWRFFLGFGWPSSQEAILDLTAKKHLQYQYYITQYNTYIIQYNSSWSTFV
jgi:hypothetical protein